MLVQIKMKMMAAMRRNNGSSLGESFVRQLLMQDRDRWLSVRDKGFAPRMMVKMCQERHVCVYADTNLKARIGVLRKGENG